MHKATEAQNSVARGLSIHGKLPGHFYDICPTINNQASEVEETLKRIQSHRGVEGVLIINKDGVALKSTLSAEQTARYASLFSQVRSS